MAPVHIKKKEVGYQLISDNIYINDYYGQYWEGIFFKVLFKIGQLSVCEHLKLILPEALFISGPTLQARDEVDASK